jgi:pyruvate kinase
MTTGVGLIRLNMSHGDHESHRKTINLIRQASDELGVLCAILLDTKGPEIRTGKLENNQDVELEKGQQFILTTDESVIGNKTIASISWPGILTAVKMGDRILIDDGLIELIVLHIEAPQIVTLVLNDGLLGSTKGVNLPGIVVDLPAVTDKDRDDVRFGVEEGVDFLAMSFIRTASAVTEIREMLGTSGIQIFSKIESQEGLDNMDAICEVSDGLTIARGDLGIEVPLETIFRIQKEAIAMCNRLGKPVMTATQMLHSMIDSTIPTCAEVSDVTNAILDGTDCISLSAETAKGKDPINVCRVASQICHHAEASINYKQLLARERELYLKTKSTLNRFSESLAIAAVTLAQDVSAAAIIAFTTTGFSCQTMSKFRPRCPIICATSDPRVARQLIALRGVFPVLIPSTYDYVASSRYICELAKEYNMIKTGDIVVVTVGKTGRQPALPYSLQMTLTD